MHKNERNGKLPTGENTDKKNVIIGCKVKKSKLLIFSSKNTCDDNLVKLCNLSPTILDIKLEEDHGEHGLESTLISDLVEIA